MIPYGREYTCEHGEPHGDCETCPGPTLLQRLREHLLDTAGLDALPEPKHLIHGVLYIDGLAWLVGRPGHGKTLVALDMAGSVGTGLSWQGYQVQQGTVLYLIAEGARGIRPRVRAWESAAGQKMTGVMFIPVAVQAATDPAWQALCDLARELGPVLIVIDTQARTTVGLEENSARDMGLFVDKLERLRASCGACVLVLHHTPRNGEHIRGSTAMEGAATTVIRVVKDGGVLTLTNDPEEGGKQKDGEPFDPIYLRLIPHDPSVIVTATDRPAASDLDSKAVREMLAGWWQSQGSEPVSVAVLVKSGVCTERTFHRHRKALVNAGHVAAEGKGNQVRYRLVRDPSA